jgi:hypothetical protein
VRWQRFSNSEDPITVRSVVLPDCLSCSPDLTSNRDVIGPARAARLRRRNPGCLSLENAKHLEHLNICSGAGPHRGLRDNGSRRARTVRADRSERAAANLAGWYANAPHLSFAKSYSYLGREISYLLGARCATPCACFAVCLLRLSPITYITVTEFQRHAPHMLVCPAQLLSEMSWRVTRSVRRWVWVVRDPASSMPQRPRHRTPAGWHRWHA